MLIKRKLMQRLQDTASGFPVLTITGPRQSGKSTLAKISFPDYKYLTLEDPDIREFAINDPRQFIRENPEYTIIDEFQKAPQLTSYLQGHIDAVNKPGMYILTGSNQFEYIGQVTQSLAGRTAIFRLLPFDYREIYQIEDKDVYEIMVKGFYPRIFDQNLDFNLFYSSYFDTYIQRDVRSLQHIRDLMVFQNFVKLCAGRTGQLLNLSSLSTEVGITHKTIKDWLSILQASYIIDLLPSYHKNFNKRILKSPKLYFLDTGLVCYLLGINNAQQLRTHPLRGEIFETFIFSELIKSRFHNGKRSNLSFFRDSNGKEIDFIAETGDGIKAIEVKLNATPGKKMFQNLHYFAELANDLKKSYLIYNGIEHSTRYNATLLGYSDIEKIEL
ncbi:MAG: ATP-binding protein [Candidatus Cloacimonetes bacterium]|nr:ATP-binding protein [Candidatus Cloacimonadota bacterium]